MNTLRIIGGVAARRKLHSPRLTTLRPTTDRVKETLFNILGAAVADAAFLDLYAGSGSVGLEALSRGAAPVILVDSSAAAIRILHANVERLGLPGARIIRRRLPGGLAATAASGPYDFIFLDPPYGTDLVERTLVALANQPHLLVPHTCFIVQHESQRTPLAAPEPYRLDEVRRIGSTSLAFLSLETEDTPGN